MVLYSVKTVSYTHLDVYKRQDLNLNIPLKTLYIGGGTPTSLNDEQLKSLMDMIRPYINNDCEVTIETNPETLDYYKLGILKNGGVTRLSTVSYTHLYR